MPVYGLKDEARHPGERREPVAEMRKFLFHLVLLLLPRSNQNRTIVFPDI